MKMILRKILYGTILLFIGLVIGILFQPLISGDNIYDQIRKFEYVLSIAIKNYVEEVDTQKMVESAIRGMLNELDPHSGYITAEQMKKVDEEFEGSFDGIGIEFDIINDTITVISPIPGGPSEALGIMTGDKIVKIDDENAVGMNRDDVPKKLRGPRGTRVEIDIIRPGERELMHYEIIRDKIPVNSVEAAFIIDGTDIGLIRLTRFSNTTHTELTDAIRKLQSQGLNRLILDLRSNPGGLLDQAYLVADEFISEGDTIVYTKGRRQSVNEVMMSTSRGLFEKLPLIVMIDAGSASASEIVSGAIQDLDRGLIVGMTSYGKGLVQRQYKPGDGSAFRITIAKYYTPSGRCIQRPYEDKERYKKLFGRLELEEGSNINLKLEKLKQEFENSDDKIEITKDYVILKIKDDTKKSVSGTKYILDSLPILKTKRGRTVLGGGGITPDYVIKYDTLGKLSRQLRTKNIFTEFNDLYFRENGATIKNKYKSDFRSFIRKFEISDAITKKFKEFSLSKDIEWNEEDFKIDESYIKTTIKAHLARSIWDRDKSLEIFYSDDKMINKAVELFPEAEKIARLK